MSKKIEILSVDGFKPFKNTQGGMSCTVTGEAIAIGATIYALNDDDARNGRGICEAEYLRLTTPVEDPKAKGKAEGKGEQKPEGGENK